MYLKHNLPSIFIFSHNVRSFKMILIKILVALLVIKKSSAEDFNLFGDAGQAYAIELSVGHPPQRLHVLIDTGSTTLAIASYARQENDVYFYLKNSSSIYDSGKEVQAKYSQGMWVGRLVSDFVKFPSVSLVPEVRCDIALITKSHKFFMNDSGWQGLLGLAYLPVGAWGENVVVESWLDSVDRKLNKPISFQLKLCGSQSHFNATHYGKFEMLDDDTVRENKEIIFRTPILRKRWYEVGVLSIRVLNSNINTSNTNTNFANLTRDQMYQDPDIDMCRKLNDEKSIVDSGTTNIRLPDTLFRQVVDEIKNAQTSDMLVLDEFWYHGEAACWPQPQKWSLPWLAIDLLSLDSDYQYFTLEIPTENYVRLVTARNMTSVNGSVAEFCYKLGIEAAGKETVLGYTAMEGLEVLFNRSAGWIGWQTSNCGPNARISGPYNSSKSLISLCKLSTPISDVAVSIKAAQWALCAVSIIAFGVLVYLLAPCVKMFFVRPMPSSPQISLSTAALVDPESR